MNTPNLNVVLLHDGMNDKNGKIVCTSLTMIDVHDIARSSKTYGVRNVFFAHPSLALRELTGSLKSHWESGFGSTYNPNRKEAIEQIEIVTSLDDAVSMLEKKNGRRPILAATSAKSGGDRLSFRKFGEMIRTSGDPYLLMLGTGWGMSDELLKRADYFLEPVLGAAEYNHLSVRSACAIMLDRLCSANRKDVYG